MNSKYFIPAVALILGFGTSTKCTAQQTSEKEDKTESKLMPKVGIKGSINFSNIYTKDADNSNMLVGFNAGLFAKLPISDFVAIQPELYYTTKGAKVSYNNAFVDGTARFNVNYVELPVLIVLNVTENFNLQVGPYIGYMVSGKVTNESNHSSFNFEDNVNTDDYNKIDAGLAVGAGFDLGGIGIGARYNYGLTKVGKERTFLGQPYTFPDGPNGVISAYVSIALD